MKEEHSHDSAVQPEAYRWAAVMALPLRLVVGWTYFSAFWRRLVLENKLIPDDPGYIGVKFNHFLPNALGIKPVIEYLVTHPSELWWFMVAFTIIEFLVGLMLMLGLLTRLASVGVFCLALGILLGSGWLDRLLADGVKYAFVSNSDNLGAQLDMNFLRWFAESGAPFVMEVTRRTEADKKGGHLAVRKADGHLILREVAQCPDADIPEFQNISKHRYFNTNTLWIRLDALKEILDANGGVLPLPMIRNSKTLNPRDPESAPVYQLETAMGAGIECFPGARAVNVPRSRFFPVKTTSDLLLLRSDAIAVDEDGKVALAPEREGKTPVVDLDSKLYKLVDSLDSLGLPSLIGLDKLTLRGRFHFQDGAVLQGTLLMENDSEETKEILPGVYAGA